MSYIDLTVHQVTETDLVDAAVQQFQTLAPNWNPSEGDTESLLIEALAVIVGQDVYAINQIPRVTLTGLLTLWGVTRKPGVGASGTVRLSIAAGTSGAQTVPAGTGFRVTNSNGVVLELTSTSDVIADPGAGSFAYVPVQVVAPGVIGNGIPPGSVVTLAQPVGWVESASLFTASSGGQEPESDDDYFARAAGFLQRQTSALVIPAHFEAWALDQNGVGRAKCISLWDGAGTVGAVTGYVTVAVTDASGGALSSGAKADLQGRMTALTTAGLSVRVVDPVFDTKTYGVTVDAQPGVDKPTLQAALVAMLDAWYSPASWPWGQVLYTNDLITKVQTFPGVLRVTATSGTALNAAVSSPIQLPAASVVPTVTVN